MTDINENEIIEKIRKFESEFFPFNMTKNNIEESIDEFLELFASIFKDLDVFLVLVPAFFEIKEWNKYDWRIEPFKYLKGFICIKNIDELVSYQNKLGDKLGGHFTKTVVEFLNSKGSWGRINVVINKRENIENTFKIKGDSIIFDLCETIFNDSNSNLEIRKEQESEIRKIKINKNTQISNDILNKYKSIDIEFADEINNNFDEFLSALIIPVKSHSIYVTKEYSLLFVFSNSVYSEKEVNGTNHKIDKGLGGLFVLVRKDYLESNIGNKIISFFERVSDILSIRIINYYQLELIKKQQLKTAIISILVDSFSHNISAHSLAALKWWFEQRSKVLDKRFKVNKDGTLLNCINPCIISIDQENTLETTEKYYDTLGLTDSTYNKEYYSLFDFLQFGDKNGNELKDVFSFTTKVANKDDKEFHPRFPVSLDYALYPFFRFLRDKGAFWSGVTRDMAFGGETKTWYKILWEDFANNPLYLGTIAKSEEITKLNIYLRIKNGEEWKEGKFVTIDMSVMDYESEITESTTSSNNNKNSNNKNIKYSQYAFIQLGEKFAEFRELLDNEEKFNVFLPGGIVGEHALFTIFENTIRNIKHYKEKDTLKDIQKNGIDFWISIEDKYLDNNHSDGDRQSGKTELFKVGVWLGHNTLLVKTIKNKKNERIGKYLLFDITEHTLKPILEESTGMPRMGGNSQDKACAAMLFNNKFSSVENKDETGRNEIYYPWIRFATVNGKEFECEIKHNADKKYIEKLKQYYVQSSNKGFLKKYFYLWHSEDFLEKNVLDSGDWENPSRAKFLVSKEKWENKDIIKARENGIIRLLHTDEVPPINSLYKNWLEQWNNIKFNDKDKVIIGLKSGKKSMLSAAGSIRAKSKNLCFYGGSSKDQYHDANVILKLSHGEEQDFHCNVRSHGAFFQKFFKEKSLKNISTLKINVDEEDKMIEAINNNTTTFQKNEVLLCEFIESVLTKIVVFDNRVNDRFKSFSYEKRKMLEEQLFLEIFGENQDDWDKIKKNNNINFLVVHLSFIEWLGYSEDNMDEFISKELGIFVDSRNFIFVITSGRGRDEWRDSIKNEKYKIITVFKPIESILSSVENGISYNDHFDVKYHLVKTLFGS